MATTTEKARLLPLKTYHEARAHTEFCDAWAIEITTKLASRAQNILKPLAMFDGKVPQLPHLRRLVTIPHLRQQFREQHNIVIRSYGTLFLLLPPSPSYTENAIASALKPHLEDFPELPRVLPVKVPRHPPTTGEKAKAWSEQYWPCTFNPASQTLQHAPPLHLLRSTLAELDTDNADIYIALAHFVAQDCCEAGLGMNVGAVVVDPVSKEVIAAAGDARWWSPARQEFGALRDITNRSDLSGNSVHTQDKQSSIGRPEHHSLMRVIAAVARKEVRRRGGAAASRIHEKSAPDLQGDPLTAVENRYFSAPEQQDNGEEMSSCWPAVQTTSRADAYLCNGLDVYLTHEPCVCCAMAMVHSRFRACIFATKMPGSGALTADIDDGGLGYGLFWRRQLNWRVMTFQYTQKMNAPQSDLKVASFNA